nr:copia protein [Tanacetum cinerariifolium]
LLRQLAREDLNQLWALVKEYLSIRPALKWKLYNLSGVHHVTAKDKEIFMLVEKDYPLRRGLALVMISYRLQVENHSQMAEDLIRKIYNITNTLRKQRESSHWQYKFPLPVKVVPTARRLEMPLSGVCTAIEEMMKKLAEVEEDDRSRLCFLGGARATGAAPKTNSILNSTWRSGGGPGSSLGKTFGNSLTTVPSQMTHFVASITLDSARSCVMQGEFLTQGTVSSILTVLSWGGSIRPEVVDVIIRIVDVVVGVPSIIKLLFVITGWTYAFHQDKASSVRVPVANVTSFSLAQLLRENTDSVRSNQRMSPTAHSIPLKSHTIKVERLTAYELFAVSSFCYRIFFWSDVSIEIVDTSMVAACAFSAAISNPKASQRNLVVMSQLLPLKFSNLSTSLLEFNLQFVEILLAEVEEDDRSHLHFLGGVLLVSLGCKNNGSSKERVIVIEVVTFKTLTRLALYVMHCGIRRPLARKMMLIKIVSVRNSVALAMDVGEPLLGIKGTKGTTSTRTIHCVRKCELACGYYLGKVYVKEGLFLEKVKEDKYEERYRDWLPKLKYVKDQLCSSCEASKAKQSSFKSKPVPSSKRRLNLLHMDLCGHSTQSKAYRVHNKRTKLIVESIHIRFDEIQEMAYAENNTSGPVTPRQEMSVDNDTSDLVPYEQKASNYDNSDPVPPLQNVVPPAKNTDSSQQELKFLFSPLFEEYFSSGTSSVNKSSSPTNNSNEQDTQHKENVQQPTTPTHGHTEENNNDQAVN